MTRNRIITFIIASTFQSTPLYCQDLIKKDKFLSKGLAIHYDGDKPIIEIEKANIQGVSHNYYESFNIGKEGALLKVGEHNFPTTVISEVTSNNESVLAGKLSVEGMPVNMIIANPNGITCTNCDFANIAKLTLITGFTSREKPIDFILTGESKITFKTEAKTKTEMAYNDISIISNNIEFKGRGNIYANKMRIISDELIYKLYGNDIPKTKGNYHGTTTIGKNVSLNINDFSVTSNKSDFINRGIVNAGNFTLTSNAILKNFKEINIKGSRISSFLTPFNIEDKYEININSNSRIKSGYFSNNKKSRFTVYKTNLDVELLDGSLINKGYHRFEYSNISFKSKNYIQKEEGDLVNVLSSVRLVVNDSVDIEGKIHTINNDYDDKIKIEQGSGININNVNVDKVIIKR